MKNDNNTNKPCSPPEIGEAGSEGKPHYNELLRSHRQKLGLTMQQVARLAGISLAQYQKFEYGTRQLSSCSMRVGLAICSALNIDPHDMTSAAGDCNHKEYI